MELFDHINVVFNLSEFFGKPKWIHFIMESCSEFQYHRVVKKITDSAKNHWREEKKTRAMKKIVGDEIITLYWREMCINNGSFHYSISLKRVFLNFHDYKTVLYHLKLPFNIHYKTRNYGWLNFCCSIYWREVSKWRKINGKWKLVI